MKSLTILLMFIALLTCSVFAASNTSIFPKENNLPEARIRVVPPGNTVNDPKKKSDENVTPAQKSNCDKIINEHPIIKDYLSQFQLNVQC